MKKMILTMVAMVMMITSVSAQRIDNTNMEARILTDKMTEELGLNSWQREKAYQMNLSYLNGISSYRDINSQVWKTRNNALKGILNAVQWKQYKNASYFYRPISWRQNTYVHNIYAKYPSKKSSFGGNRANKPVTFPAPATNAQWKQAAHTSQTTRLTTRIMASQTEQAALTLQTEALEA